MDAVIPSGTRIGRYEIQSKIGAGGMGEVYLAADTQLGRRVALKLLPANLTDNKERLSRFKQEARAASTLNHPNILTIHEIDQENSVYFIATEFIDGITLRQHMQNTCMQIAEVLDVVIQVASALAAAHEAGIVHRDIKPENIMRRRDGYIKVLDFGLAKLTQTQPGGAEASTLAQTDPGIVIGTVHYLSSEQARGLKVDARTDIFSLGIVLYELIAGRAPFEGTTKSEVIAAILEREPAPLARFARDVPTELERIVTKALAKDREERYQTVKDFLIDLRKLKQRLEFAAEIERSQSNMTGEASTASRSAQAQVTRMLPTVRPTSGAERVINQINRHQRALVIALAAVGITIAAAAYFRFGFSAGSKAIESLAVLPFVNASADPNTEYLSDGITDTLINNLSQLPNLRVMSRNSVFRFKGREMDAQSVARELNVRAVLTGRVVQHGDAFSISVELVDAHDNSHLWGAQYNRQLGDIFAVQEEIAKEISEKLRLRLSGAEQKLLTKRGTDNTEAYQLYLKGEYFRNKWTPEGTAKAIEFYNQAIAQDPAYAPAYRGLAAVYGIRAVNGMSNPQEDFPKAKAAVTKALEIDETLASAHHSRGQIALMYDRDWPTAGREFERAIELNPNDGPLYGLYACYLSTTGRSNEAIAAARRGVELDPLSLIGYWDLSLVYYQARQFDQAIEASRRANEIDQNFPLTHIALGKAYMQKGMREEAIAELQHPSVRGNAEALAYLGYTLVASGRRSEAMKIVADLEEQSKQKYVPPIEIAILYAGLGDKEQAFAQLEKAYEEHNGRMYEVNNDPAFDNLRSHPRFAELLRRMNLTS